MAPNSFITELPASQKAVVAKSVGNYELITTHRLPVLNPTSILVKVSAVALNPANWKMIDISPPIGVVGGNDFSGTICALGDGVTANLKKGDKVCGSSYGLDPTLGANEWAGSFAEYIAIDARLVMRVPTVNGVEMSMTDAASLGVGIMTAGIGLYKCLQLPMPEDSPSPIDDFVFIHGGNTATGTIAIQLSKLSGLKVIVTCSPSNFSKVERLGAVKAFDYKSATCGNAIRAFTKGKLRYVLDCISDIESMRLCYSAIGPKGGKYVSLEPPSNKVAATRKNVSTDWVMMLSIFGKEVVMDGNFSRPADTEHYEFAVDWYQRAEALLLKGSLSPHSVRVLDGGLAAVIGGIQELKVGNVRGEKLVCKVV